MKRQPPNIFRILAYAGVYVGAVIGAGFASDQEVLQFFASYGLIGIVIMSCTFYKTITGEVFSDKVEKRRLAMLAKESLQPK